MITNPLLSVSCLVYLEFDCILVWVAVTEAHNRASWGEVIYYSTPALFRVLTNVALLDSAGGASHQITFTNEPQQDTSEPPYQTSQWLTILGIFSVWWLFCREALEKRDSVKGTVETQNQKYIFLLLTRSAFCPSRMFWYLQNSH